MSRKDRMIFTDNKHSKRGIMSLVLGVICLGSLLYSIIYSYAHEGNVNSNFGAALVLTLLMAFVGLFLGIWSRNDIRKFRLFPNLGIIFNGIIIIFLAIILGLGLK